MTPLKDLDRKFDLGVEGVVTRRVLIESVVQRHQAPESVVEHVQPVGAPPLVDATVAEISQPVAVEIERRRQQHQTLNPLRIKHGGIDRDKAAEAGTDET